MNKKTLFPLLGAGLALMPLRTSDAALLVYYNFNGGVARPGVDGEAIANLGTLGTAGVLDTGTDAGNAVDFLASGAPGGGLAVRFTPGTDGGQNLGAPNIGTGFTAAMLGVAPNTAYTIMAWANFANATGDNMIFGQGHAGDSLHNGSRNGSLHSGHWGDDLGPDQAVNISSQPGTWHHVAYTNDGAAGMQSIYFDGALVAGPAAAGVAGTMALDQLILIGSSNNGGSFNGMLDEVKMYNTLLSQSEIQAASVVPEPTSMAFLAMWGLGAGMALRRRRGAAR